MTQLETLESALGIDTLRHNKLIWYLDDAFETGVTKSDVINYIANIADLTPVERTWMGYMVFQRLLLLKVPLGKVLVNHI